MQALSGTSYLVASYLLAKARLRLEFTLGTKHLLLGYAGSRTESVQGSWNLASGAGLFIMGLH